MRAIILLVSLLLTFPLVSFAKGSDSEIEFDLYLVTASHNVFSVQFTNFNGEKESYILKEERKFKGQDVALEFPVFYDSVSNNFFSVKGKVITIIPMNRPYKLKFHGVTP